jgi:hypothetical protein
MLARLLEDISKLEGDNIDIEADNIDMEEDNIGTYRKKPYQSVKRPETTDTEQIIDSSDSVISAVVQRANFNERVVRMLTTLPKFEGDGIETEGSLDDIESDHSLLHVLCLLSILSSSISILSSSISILSASISILSRSDLVTVDNNLATLSLIFAR